jgi:hypothetical protein
MSKAAINKDNALFTSELAFTFREKLVKCYVWNIALYGVKIEHYGKYTRNILESLKCGAGEGWKDELDRSCGK